ncbi:MAG TPA: hypothetical protein VFQ65_30950 [Kofleriaceae bacterium]|nr:hypothetical protein [Kofleriaceae bacterium]
MSRTRTFFTLVFPSMLAGGVLFGSAFGHADSGRGYGNYWPSSGATVVAQADPRPVPRPRPAPPAPPAPYAPYATPATPPMPPMPPSPHTHGGSGFNIQMHGGKIQIDGVNDIVESSIKSAQEAIKNSNLPADVRDKLQKRLDKVRTKVEDRLSHLDASDLDQLGDELGKMGDDIGKEMDEFGKEMEKYGDKMSKDAMKNFGKNWGKNWGQHGQHHWKVDVDGDNDNDDEQVDSVPDIDDQEDLDDAVRNLGDLSLKGPQRDQIQRLRADSDRQVAAAKRQLDQASEALSRELDNANTSDAEISRAIDAVTQQEAVIRKARILAWHGARRVLDDAQRHKVEDAARAHKGPRPN